MGLHAMNPVDAAWYHMDGPANPAVVNGPVTTRRPLDFAHVQAVLQERLLRFDRFRQRVVEPPLHLIAPHCIGKTWANPAAFGRTGQART